MPLTCDLQDELQEGEEEDCAGRVLSPGAWPRAWHGGGARALDAQVVSADRTAQHGVWLLLGQPARPGLPAVAWIAWNGATHSHTWLAPLLPILQLGTEAQGQGATRQGPGSTGTRLSRPPPVGIGGIGDAISR